VPFVPSSLRVKNSGRLAQNRRGGQSSRNCQSVGSDLPLVGMEGMFGSTEAPCFKSSLVSRRIFHRDRILPERWRGMRSSYQTMPRHCDSGRWITFTNCWPKSPSGGTGFRKIGVSPILAVRSLRQSKGESGLSSDRIASTGGDARVTDERRRCVPAGSSRAPALRYSSMAFSRPAVAGLM